METVNRQSITIDIRKPNLISTPQFIQGDTNIIDFTVKDNGADADLSGIGRIVVNYKRTDKKVTSRLLEAVGNTVTYRFGQEEMEKHGIGELELQFFSADDLERISTLKMKVNVINSIGSVALQQQADDVTALQELFIEVNDKGTFAQESGDYALEKAGEADTAALNAQQVADENKTTFLNAVDTVATRDSTYPDPNHGDTVRVTSEARSYRYVEGSGWKITDEYNPTAIDEVNAQLADIAYNVKSYGAKGDGITNDTTVLQNLIN
ncbi:glycoside hydrolase family 55 protein, partial [Bacillus sp. MCCB 382]|uniref:BppU family phage baseplate upper protein n=1 Tax=Bacillus sp. MCCB 382 TaxID=2860197 RepID=UPI001C56145D|nr:glycoside hydrolase family 55 protein [Bacillus sp. MCCB 382]